MYALAITVLFWTLAVSVALITLATVPLIAAKTESIKTRNAADKALRIL